MAKIVKKSVVPIYSIGVVWMLFALLGTLYRVSDYLLCAGLSLGAFAVLSGIFPNKTYETPDSEPAAKAKAAPAKEEKAKSSGNPEVDALVRERDKALSEMRRLNDAIQDPQISAQIDHLEQVTRRITDHVASNPKKLPQIRKFMNYYLPTTLKLLNAYDRMDSTGIAGDNITSTKRKVEDMLDTITKAFDKQLDALFGEEALDISTDITVMENMLAQEGLAGLNINDAAQGGGDITLSL